MARTLLTLLLVSVLMSVTSGQTSCPFVDDCQEKFQDEAKDIGHDHAKYCELQRQELLCARNVLSRCPPDTRAFAQAQIQRIEGEQLSTCDLTSGQTSCPFVDDCQERFLDEAKDIGNDHAEYCELQRQELLCARNVLSRCPPDTRAFAQAQIQRMEGEQLSTCDLTSGQTSCPFVDDCQERFQDEAKDIGHDHAEYCELQRQELLCARNVLSRCPPDTRAFAQAQIQRMEGEQLSTCDLTSGQTSCPFVDDCQERFQDEAKDIGNDHAKYCELQKQKLLCAKDVLSWCPGETRVFAQAQIQRMEAEQLTTCNLTSGQECPFVDDCQERFQDEAKDIGHDHAEYCELQRQELLCAQNVLSRCPSDTRAFAEAQIQRMQGEQLTTCGASLTVSSTIVLSLVSILAFLLKNFM